MIGDLVEWRRGLDIWCTWHLCRRHVYWPPAKAVRLLGARTRLDDAERRLRCHVCGARSWGPRR